MLHLRFAPTMVGLLLLSACGRTGIDLPTDEVADDGGGGADEIGMGMEDGVAFVDPDDPDAPPPPNPPPAATCGNGTVDPGELCHQSQVEFWSRIDPCALDVGDIDGDGHLDVVTPNSDFEHLESPQNLTSVLFGDGQGRLSEPVPYVSGDDIPVGVRLGDLDGSGDLDVIVVNSDAGSLTVLLNFGAQQLGDAGRVAAGSMPVIADVGDVNGDGVLDVAVAATDEVRVALGRGDGNFEPSTRFGQPGMLWAARLLDLDGDGATDMLASNTTAATVHVWRGDGNGQLLDAGRLDMPGLPLGIADADVDADGDLDLLVAHSFGAAVLLGEGDGSFFTTAQVVAGVGPRDVAVGDYDQDGHLDLAIVNSTSQDVTLALGRGDGEFHYIATYAVGSLPSGIEAGDFNSDGVPDLAVSNQLSNSIGLILSDP
jgi:FG-GAP-like repeat